MATFQDWTTVGWDKRGEKKAGESKTQYMNTQAWKGNIISHVKETSSTQNKDILKFDYLKIEKASEEDSLNLTTVGKRIAQSRNGNKLSRK